MKKKIIEILFLAIVVPNLIWGQKMPVFGDEKCAPLNDSVSNCEYDHVYAGKVAEGIRINGKASGLWTLYSNKVVLQKRYYTKGHLDSLLVYYPDGKFNRKEYYHYDLKLDSSIIYESYAWYATGQKLMQLKNNYHIEYYIDGTKRFEGKYAEPFSKKDSTWVWYYNGQISKIENYKNGIRNGDWITFGKGTTVSEKKTYQNGILVGDDISNSQSGKLNILIRHNYDEKKRTLIDSTFYGEEKKLGVVDSSVFLAGDTIYKSSRSFYPPGDRVHFTKYVTISLKKDEKEIYRRDIHYWPNQKIKDDFSMNFSDKSIEPKADVLTSVTSNSYSLAHVKSFYTYYENGSLGEKYLFLNNDSIYLTYESYNSYGGSLCSFTRYNPSKTDKILKYYTGKLKSYSFTRPDLTYVNKEFDIKGQIREEKIGNVKTVKNKITLKDKTEDLYTEKKWNDKNKLIYIKQRSENTVSIKEYFDNGQMKLQIDSLTKISGKMISIEISRKEWQDDGTLFKKEKNEQTINLALSVLKITETGVYWDSTYSMLSGTVMILDDKQFLGYCAVTLTDGKNKLETSSEENGYFEFKKLPAGEYTLICSFPSFSPLVSIVSVKPKQTIKCTVRLKQLEQETRYSRNWYDDY